jgi:hypothetical protein
MSGKSFNLSRRLAAVEQRLAETAKRKSLDNCNCIIRPLFPVKDEKEFEAQTNVACPVHGFRRLERLVVVTIVRTSRSNREESRLEESRLEQVVDQYQRRLAEFRKSHPEFEDDFKKL